MSDEAFDVAREVDRLARSAGGDAADTARVTVAEAYASVVVSRNRAGDYAGAEALLPNGMSRDGILFSVVGDRAAGLDFDGVRDGISGIRDPFSRGRACFGAAKVSSALGPAFNGQTKALLNVGMAAMEQLEGTDSRFRTLAAELIAFHAREGGDTAKLLDQVRSLPLEYRVPGRMAAALDARARGAEQDSIALFRQALAEATAIDPAGYVTRVHLLQDGMAEWTLEAGDATAPAKLAREQEDPAVRAACLPGVARGLTFRANLLALGGQHADRPSSTLWQKLVADWGEDATVQTDHLLFVDKEFKVRTRRQVVAFRTPDGVGFAFPPRLSGWAWWLEAAPTLGGVTQSKDTASATAEALFGPLGSKERIGSLRFKKSLMSLPPHWVVIEVNSLP
jgi:hypothetical protein